MQSDSIGAKLFVEPDYEMFSLKKYFPFIHLVINHYLHLK